MDQIQKLKKAGDTKCIYRNELDKACFQHDMAYGDFEYSVGRTAADKILRDKAFNIAKDLKYDRCQRGLACLVYKSFNNKTAGSCIKSMPQNQQLAEELHKSIIRKFKKRKVYLSLQGNTWGAGLADMQSISRSNRGFRFFYVLLLFLANMLGLFL